MINATATIGRVILASAATVAFAFLAMVFAKLSVFAALGPACAIAVFVGFAATVTLFPRCWRWRPNAASVNPRQIALAATGTGSPWRWSVDPCRYWSPVWRWC